MYERSIPYMDNLTMAGKEITFETGVCSAKG
jgi:hypothetical protein